MESAPRSTASAPSAASTVSPQNSIRYAAWLAVITGLAIAMTMPYSNAIMSQVPGAATPRTDGVNVWVVFWLLVLTVAAYLVIRMGLTLGRRVGLGWPPILGWQTRASSPRVLREALITSLLVGVALGALLLLSSAALRDTLPSVGERWPEPWIVALASMGSIHEEVWFRLGAMTLFAWLLTSMLRREAPGPWIMWSANVAAAILFGAFHFPNASGFTPLTLPLVGSILANNGVVGVACGWLYWRKGLVAAMIAHATCNLVSKLLMPFVAAQG